MLHIVHFNIENKLAFVFIEGLSLSLTESILFQFVSLFSYPLWPIVVFASTREHRHLLINWPNRHFIFNTIRPAKKKTFKFFIFFLLLERSIYHLIGFYIYLRCFSLFILSLFARDHLDTLSKKRIQKHSSNIAPVRTVILLLSIHKQSRHINRMKNNPNGNRYIFPIQLRALLLFRHSFHLSLCVLLFFSSSSSSFIRLTFIIS